MPGSQRAAQNSELYKCLRDRGLAHVYLKYACEDGSEFGLIRRIKHTRGKQATLVGFGPGVGRGFLESRIRVAEYEMNTVGGAVTLLGNQEFSLGAFLRGFVGLERIGPVNKHHHVSILFD